MRIINQTKNTLLAQEVFVAKSILARTKGLLGRKAFLPGEAIILDPCNSVHTFFMLFAIDILFVSKDYRVVKAIPNLRPNRATSIYWHSKMVIELPVGSISLTNTRAGDQLQLLD
jgi:uncharacterized protein